jgi:hypothetical protein
MDHAVSEPDPGVIPGTGNPGLNGEGHPPEVAGAARLERLPPEIGALLMVVGIAGLLLPGPVGSPFFIAGGVALWPAAFGRVEGWFRRRFPNAHRTGMEQMVRYLADLERRYPGCLESRKPGRS